MRSIVRRDTGEGYEEFLTGLAKASGIGTPTRADLARLDRKRKKKGSNDDWTSPADPDAKIAKMKDGRTHLAHKAEHAVDLDTGAIVAVTIQGADQGDTATLPETLAEAVEQLDQVTDAEGEPVALADEVVADKGCHSRAVVLELSTHGFRTYISEPERGPNRGRSKKRRATPSTAIGAAFAASAGRAPSPPRGAGRTDASRIPTTPAACDGRICAAPPISSNASSFTSAALIWA